MNRRSPSVINEINWKGSVINDNALMANAFNEYFCTIGNELANSFTNDEKYKQYLTKSLKQSFFFSPIIETEVLEEINNLPTGKSPGIDGIPSKVIKASVTPILGPLTHIYNCSFQQGIVPSPFKVAKTIPIHKKNDKRLPGNFRPISLLIIFNKLLEKLVHKRIYSFLNSNQLLNKFQFGFRKNHSTTSALDHRNH